MSWYEQRGNYNVTGYLGTKRQRGEHGRWTPVFVAAEREDDRRISLAYPAHYHIMPRFSFDGDVFLGTMLTNAQDASPSTPSTLTVSGTTPFKLESCDARDVSPFDRIYVCWVDGKRVTIPALSLDSDIHRDAIQVGVNLAPVDSSTAKTDYIDVLLDKPTPKWLTRAFYYQA